MGGAPRAERGGAESRLAILRRGRVGALASELVEEWRDDRVGGLAAEIAFFAILSIFPAMLAIAAALGFLDDLIGSRLAAQAKIIVVDFLEGMLTTQASEAVASVRRLFEEQSPGVLSAATAGAVWTVSRGVLAAIRALNVAYDLPHPRSWLRSRAKALVLGVGTVLLFVLVLAVVVSGPVLGAGRALGRLLDLPEAAVGMWLWFRYPVAFALLLAWAILLFHFGPNQRSPVRWELPGAAVTGVLWLSTSLGFRLYLAVAQDFNRVLGVLGGALILLIWLYLLSLSLLLGAEVNSVLASRRGRARRPREEASAVW